MTKTGRSVALARRAMSAVQQRSPGPLLGAGAATGGVSYFVQKLSAPALWMPTEYKLMLLTVVPVMCSLVLFVLVQRLASKLTRGGESRGSKRTSGTGRLRTSRLLCATACALLCILSTMWFFDIRDRCIVSFQSDVDLREEFVDSQGQYREQAVPYFLDLERSRILVPARWSAETASFLKEIEDRQHVSDGLQYVLSEAPYTIVKALQGGPDKVLLNETQHTFLLRYGFILVTFTSMLGFALESQKISTDEAKRIIGASANS